MAVDYKNTMKSLPLPYYSLVYKDDLVVLDFRKVNAFETFKNKKDYTIVKIYMDNGKVIELKLNEKQYNDLLSKFWWSLSMMLPDKGVNNAQP